MPLPALPCLPCIVPPQNICIGLPGGVNLCASLPNSIVPDISEIARQAFAQVNSALTPLVPIFNVLDAIKAVFDCVSAVPKAITELDVVGLLECAPNMVEKVSKLAALFPPLSIPGTIRDVLSVMILALEGLKQDLESYKIQADRILEAATAAQLPGNAPLLGIVACAQDFYAKVMEHVANGATPLNRLLGLLNMLIGLIPGVQPIPCIGGLDGTPDIVIGILERFIQVLKIVRSLLPGGLKINPFVPKGINC